MSLPKLVDAATEIVLGQAGERNAVEEGGVIYTLTTFRVEDQWKGEPAQRLGIALPGGTHNGVTQRFGGVPTMPSDTTFVAFLWRGSSGRRHLVGLSQGLLEVVERDTGELWVERRPTSDFFLSDAGEPAVDQGVAMPLRKLIALIQSQLPPSPSTDR